MKKILLAILLLPLAGFSQQSPRAQNDTLLKQELTQKIKRQKTAMLVTSVTGGVLALTGLIMFLSNFEAGLTPNDPNYNESESNTGETLAYVGCGLIAGGIPFAIAYKRNKKALATLTVRNQVSLLYNRSFAPAVCLRISIGRQQ